MCLPRMTLNFHRTTGLVRAEIQKVGQTGGGGVGTGGVGTARVFPDPEVWYRNQVEVTRSGQRFSRSFSALYTTLGYLGPRVTGDRHFTAHGIHLIHNLPGLN